MPSLDNCSYWASSFEQEQRLPGAWRFTAWKLKEAAELLRSAFSTSTSRDQSGESEDPGELRSLSSVYRMLLGFSFENMLKGIIIAKKSALDISKLTSSHDIATLIRRANLELPEEDVNLLDRLTPFVLWGGRYPMPRKQDEYVRFVEDDGVLLSADLARYDEIWSDLCEILKKIGWFGTSDDPIGPPIA